MKFFPVLKYLKRKLNLYRLHQASKRREKNDMEPNKERGENEIGRTYSEVFE